MNRVGDNITSNNHCWPRKTTETSPQKKNRYLQDEIKCFRNMHKDTLI